jgi:hypothetical protein
MRQNNVELLIFIKGSKAAIEYTSPRDFQTYIEGREGSEFEIEVVNHNNTRVEAVVTVDGLSVLDGQPGGDDTRGYIVTANSRVRIPGWKLNGNEVAKFVFSGRKGGSYVEQSTGQATNKGVIGLMVFEEVVRHYVSPGYFAAQPLRARGFQPGGEQMKGGSRAVYQSGVAGSSNAFASKSATLSARTSAGSASTAHSSASTAAVSAVGAATSTSLAGDSINLNNAAVTQTLGTGFGERMDFQTQSVSFIRGDMLVLMALWYDDKRGLQKRGIETVRPSQVRYSTTPNPFPNRTDQGCTPPEGWQG